VFDEVMKHFEQQALVCVMARAVLAFGAGLLHRARTRHKQPAA
jgi:hypothetical protein